MRIILYASIVVLTIAFPQDTVSHASQALRIWGENIVPTLFPYMVFSRLLSQHLKSTQRSVIPVTALLGILGGSPSGSMLIASVASKLSRRSLHALCAFCGTISPMFILGSLQTWTGDPNLCRFLLMIHWMAAFLSAGFVWLLDRNHVKYTSADLPTFPSENTKPLSQCIDAILHVGGCIICYSVLAGFVAKLLPPRSALQTIFHTILEISGGTHAVWNSPLSQSTKIPLLSAALGFSGLSILAQNHELLGQVGISMLRLVFYAALRAVCAFACVFLLTFFT